MTTSYTVICNDLMNLYERAKIESGTTCHFEFEELAIAAFVRTQRDDSFEMSVHVADRLNVSPDLQYLAWGIVREGDNAPIVVGRTNTSGQFLVTLPAGRYRVRYVAEPTTTLDCDILRAIGDAEALSMLDDVGSICRVAAAPTIPSWTFDWPASIAVSSIGFRSDDEASPAAPPPAVAIVDGHLRIRIPLDALSHTFEYAAALVEYETSDQRVVLHRLVPVARDPVTKCYVGNLDLTEHLSSATMDVHRIHVWEICDRDPHGLGKLRPSDVDLLLTDPLIKYDQARREAVLRLRACLEQE